MDDYGYTPDVVSNLDEGMTNPELFISASIREGVEATL